MYNLKFIIIFINSLKKKIKLNCFSKLLHLYKKIYSNKNIQRFVIKYTYITLVDIQGLYKKYLKTYLNNADNNI